MAVTIQNVRDLLDSVPAGSVQDATVQSNIDRATRFVNSVKDPDAVTADVDDAITAMAVWLTYGSYTEGIAQQFGGTALVQQVKIDHYRRVAELFINKIAREPVDLAIDDITEQTNLIGVDPSVNTLTASEAFPK